MNFRGGRRGDGSPGCESDPTRACEGQAEKILGRHERRREIVGKHRTGTRSGDLGEEKRKKEKEDKESKRKMKKMEKKQKTKKRMKKKKNVAKTKKK